MYRGSPTIPAMSMLQYILVLWLFLGSVCAESENEGVHTRKCFLYHPDVDARSDNVSSRSNAISYLNYPAEKWISWRASNGSADTDLPDKHYFRFTKENLDSSKVDEFYAQWTIERQTDPAWKEIGEWKLFNSDFGDTLNFECGAGLKHCIDKPTLADLQHLWPGTQRRAFVRRIYFVLKKYELLHAYTEELMEMFQVTHTNLIGVIPELITAFTQQADQQKLLHCAVVKMCVDQAVNIAVSVASSLIGGSIASISSAGMKMAFTKPRFGKPDAKAISKVEDRLVAAVAKGIADDAEKQIVESNMRAAIKSGVNDVKKQIESLAHVEIDPEVFKAYKAGLSNAKPIPFDWFGILWGQLFKYGPYKNIADTKRHWNDLNIEGGMSYDSLCSQFEGSFKDKNPQNKDKLSKTLTQVFGKIRQQTQKTFGAIYVGAIIEPGEPSLMARMMSNRVWDGEGSALENLREPVNLQWSIEKAMVKNIASELLARNYNYMKCTHHPQATKICRDAQGNKSKIGLSRFCPEPMNDPNLVCQLGKWYFSVHQQHEIEMTGLKSFKSLLNDQYNFTLEEFEQEAWDSYKMCGNDCRDTDWESLPFGGSITSKWKLPTCVNDGVHLNDFLIHQGQLNNVHAWGFPSICGNFHSDETQDFMDAMHIGIGSEVYKGRDPSELWEDRIPRELDDLPPYENYMALCKHGVRFPRHKEYPNLKNTPIKGLVGPAVNYKYYHWGSDVDCDKVANATAELDEYDANKWFCFSEVGKQIQKSQRSHVDMAHIPNSILFGAKKKCKKWSREGGGV